MSEVDELCADGSADSDCDESYDPRAGAVGVESTSSPPSSRMCSSKKDLPRVGSGCPRSGIGAGGSAASGSGSESVRFGVGVGRVEQTEDGTAASGKADSVSVNSGEASCHVFDGLCFRVVVPL